MKIRLSAKLQKTLAYLIAVFLTVTFITLIILPAEYFDTGSSTCISVILFDIECYGCGMTRAIQHLIHLDFESAYKFNKFSFIVLPLAVFMIAWELKRIIIPKK